MAAAKVIRYSFVFVVQVLLMNLLSPAEFGLMRYVTIVLGVINVINAAGLSVALVQREHIRRAEIGPAFSLNMVLSGLLFGAVWLTAPLLAHYYREPELVALLRAGAIAIPIGGVSIIHRGLLQRRFKYMHLAVLEAVAAAVGSGVSLLLATRGYGVWSLVWGTIAFNVVSSAIAMASQPAIWPSVKEFSCVIPLMTAGVAWTAECAIEFASKSIDSLLVGRAFGSGALGIYGAAIDICALPLTAFAAVMVPVALAALSRMQSDRVRLESAYLQLTVVAALASAPFMAIVGVQAEDIMTALTMFMPSDKWMPAAGLLRVLAVMGLFSSWTVFSGALWISRGRVDVQIYWTIAMAVTVAGAVLLGAPFGIAGVCVALVVRSVGVFPAAVWVCASVAGVRPAAYVKCVIPALVCGGGAVAGSFAVTALWQVTTPIGHAMRLVAGSVAAVAVYAALVRVVFPDRWTELRGFLPGAKTASPLQTPP